MKIDFSPLQGSTNEILFGLIKVLGIPFIAALLIGFLLLAIKVPRKIVIGLTSLLFIFGVYQMFILLDL